MKTSKALAFLLIIVIIAWALPALGQAPFDISRLVVGTGIEDREPMGVGESFPADTERVYCFLDATNIAEDTQVTFVWLHEGRETGRVELPLTAGPRWRTYSSKKLGGLAGQWTVELRDQAGEVLQQISFTVQ